VSIPRILHQVWLGSPLPALMHQWALEWQEAHPEWDYWLWTEAAYQAGTWRLEEFHHHASKYAPGHEGQFRSDLLRYEILHQFGGVYLDTDMQCLRPLDELLEPEWEAFVGWEEPGQWLNNAVLGAWQAHEWLGELLEHLPGHIHRMHKQHGTKAKPNRLTGPKYVTPVTLNLLEKGGSQSPRVELLPKGVFFPYLWSEVRRYDPSRPAKHWREHFPGSFAVHHWHNRRRRREETRI
jgi:inositol phosphorylceramide mannosyltransferase catalytic subunit